jgi:hypothetical protein
MSLEKLRREILKFVAEKYREDGSVPSTRCIINEFNLKSASKLCKMFPGCLKQICRGAGVPYPAERLKLVANALKARKRSAERLERGDFDFEFERSELEAKIKELKYAFHLETESVRDKPYWRARREQFDRLCDWIIKQLREVEPEAFKDLYRDFKKLSTRYAEIINESTLFDRIEEQKKLLMQLKGKCLEYQKWQDAIEKRYGVPLDGMLPVIAELATAKERFGLTAEQVETTGRFVSVMIKAGWKPETLTWYIHEHFQNLLDIDSLMGEKKGLEEEIAKLAKRRNALLMETSDLRSVRERVAEEAHALKVVENSASKMLNEEMEILGKAQVNNIVAGNMYKAGVDALAKAILNDPRFISMRMVSALNESLAKQTENFTEIVKNNLERLKQEVTKMSIIAELLQSRVKA